MTDQTKSVMTDRAQAMALTFMTTTHPAGQRVRVLGGFGHGATGRIIGARQHAAGSPYASDYPVFYILTDAGEVLGGWDAGSLEPIYRDGCTYCGDGVACRGSARTTFGADLEAFDAAHPVDRDPDRVDMGYLLECYGCGAFGTLDLFGMGRARQCPNCGSREVHNGPELTS